MLTYQLIHVRLILVHDELRHANNGFRHAKSSRADRANNHIAGAFQNRLTDAPWMHFAEHIGGWAGCSPFVFVLSDENS